MGVIQTMNGLLAFVVQGMAELEKAVEALPKPEDRTGGIVAKENETFSLKITSNLIHHGERL